ncbi:hypothetical protein [Metabacillus rhizolycopersici]|jgi:hypothetical protein|uniref:DUF3794 domain-containing protein n=1 Tax=Metabacillus rhizolycopersici TaxID=2875709 RepID=A0ABS7UZA1_9BACI|nr:hypothetical protein [Metabacillus rhizolycopersici]MBZ5753652.1 hypothetical protein [Metabacillus rhizolycopersici]
MEFKHINGKQETLCIKVPKVYDWVVGQIQVPVQSFRGTSGLERLNFTCDEINEQVQGGQLTAECILTDENGHPVDPLAPGSISCTEIDGRNDVNVILPTGETVTLQKVIVLKKGYFVVQISNVRGESCISSPQPFSVCEQFLLCAPEGTFLKCTITEFECNACFMCNLDNVGNPSFQQIDVSINMCQNVQMESIVTLEIDANICQPRSEIVVNCPPKNLPPQCPAVFSGTE